MKSWRALALMIIVCLACNQGHKESSITIATSANDKKVSITSDDCDTCPPTMINLTREDSIKAFNTLDFVNDSAGLYKRYSNEIKLLEKRIRRILADSMYLVVFAIRDVESDALWACRDSNKNIRDWGWRVIPELKKIQNNTYPKLRIAYTKDRYPSYSCDGYNLYMTVSKMTYKERLFKYNRWLANIYRFKEIHIHCMGDGKDYIYKTNSFPDSAFVRVPTVIIDAADTEPTLSLPNTGFK